MVIVRGQDYMTAGSFLNFTCSGLRAGPWLAAGNHAWVLHILNSASLDVATQKYHLSNACLLHCLRAQSRHKATQRRQPQPGQSTPALWGAGGTFLWKNIWYATALSSCHSIYSRLSSTNQGNPQAAVNSTNGAESATLLLQVVLSNTTALPSLLVSGRSATYLVWIKLSPVFGLRLFRLMNITHHS